MTNPVANVINAVEKRDSFKSNHTILNSDCTIKGKYDSIGRKRHIDMEKGRDHVALYTKSLNIRLDEAMYKKLQKIPVRKRGQKVREYIEWGLENEE